MNPIRIMSVLAVAAMSLLFSCKPASSSFVKVVDGRFSSEDFPSHYIGTNFWYGAILASDGEGGDIERLEAELDSLNSLGLNNLRILVGGDGPNGVPTRVEPTLQKEPGVYNDTIFRGLDRLLVEMAERNMKAVLYLNNSWEWSGGYGMYLEWAGEGRALVPAVDGWPQYMEHVSGFVTSEKAKSLYADHVRNVVTRVNSITGKPYREDPAIFSWQIGNEPRCFRQDAEGQEAFVEWLWSSAALIKSLDPNHMVSTGSEGKWGCEGSMELYERIHSCPDIDYMTIHIWPYNWNWVEESTLKTDLPEAVRNTDEYIDEHIAVAGRYGKPVVLEEFGFPRDDFRFAQGTPTEARDGYYRHVLGRVAESAREGGLFAGINFWGWGGLAGQSDTNIYWKKGDDYCGDPAQEQQGLNSVYAGDRSTVAVIRQAAEDVKKALKPQAWFELSDNSGIFASEGKNTINIGMKAHEDCTVTAELVLSTDFGELVDTFTRKVEIVSGTAGFSFDLDLAPGFYKAVLNLVEEDGSRHEMAATNLGCNPEGIASPQDKQPDFDLFWDRTLKELAAVGPDFRFKLLKEHSNEVRNAYRIDMKSLGGENISGLLYVPVAEGTYPAMISYMGYGSDVWYSDPSANPQMIEFLLCIRNQAMNRTPGEENDWCARGIESKDTYYYRGAFADAVRAVDLVCSLDKTDKTKVFANGESQGGALTLVAASLDPRIKAIAPSAPFLCDYKDYFSLAGWPGEPIRAKAREAGITEDEMFRTLSYFDVKNFTDRIECPVLMAIGLQDPVCPPHTNFAGYNQIKGDKSWVCYPHSGHNVWEQPGWPKAKDEFFRSFM